MIQAGSKITYTTKKIYFNGDYKNNPRKSITRNGVVIRLVPSSRLGKTVYTIKGSIVENFKFALVKLEKSRTPIVLPISKLTEIE